ncbi:MAG: asparagine--tRNA ligase [Erysipelotrichaceae bacterium]|nr:asparagine--tRNA ligase [Erysipelotrichaceae bacterium]MDY5251795.1 asparagine--tRNA ligase [Erysipelotrichaceae bacterium]
MLTFMTVRELYEVTLSADQIEKDQIEYVQLEGWIRTNRNNGSVGFIELNDGTYFKNAQLVYTKDLANFSMIDKYSTGSAINAIGKYKITPQAKQPFEIEVTQIELEGDCDSSYPLQKKRHSFEYLREIPHLRPRANTFSALYRVRNVLAMAIHEFFQDQGFMWVHTPIITGNDGEGAGELFKVETGKKDEFFGKEAFLTCTGQLHVEAFALAFRDVYTFGPAFRAENSHTPIHAAEFWMVEPEIAFANLEDDMNLIEDMIKYCIDYVLENASVEMEFFNNMIDKECLARIKKVRDSEFKRMSYTEAIAILEKADVKFENKVYWGMDLNTEHERYICEKIVNGPVFLTDYPKDIKAFYMRLNDDGKTVAACDLLVPGVGELVGGSQREERYDVLSQRMDELKMNKETLQWYLDLRRFGGCQHAGFGLGFDRFLMYLTGMGNIRDCEPYPRTTNNCVF